MEMPHPTTVTLQHINVRDERHGEETVDAYDLDFTLEGANNDVLGRLDPDLCTSLYHRSGATEAQKDLPVVDRIAPNLRYPKLGSLSWSDRIEGADLLMLYGTARRESNIVLPGGRWQTKKIELREGGSVTLALQFQTSDMPDGVLDKLRKKLKQAVTITVVQSEEARKAKDMQPPLEPPKNDKPPEQQQLTPEEALANSVNGG